MKNAHGDVLLKLDSRGRVTIGGPVAKNGRQPSEFYRLVFGEFGSLQLLPVRIELEMEAKAACGS